jgi:hypothetical protein
MQQFDSVKSVASSDKQQLLSLLITVVHRKDVSHDDARSRAVSLSALKLKQIRYN